MAQRGVAAASVLTSCLLASAGWAADIAGQTTANSVEPNEEVVITATERSASVLDIPGSVSILTANRLEESHVTGVKELTALAPQMTVLNSIGESFGQLIAFRGVATSGADIGLESTVGVTVDGVPLLRPNLAIFDLANVERVEMLRGPQGTLFGTNTTAGLINVLTRAPSFAPEFSASATVGELDERELRVSANGGLIPGKLAGRIDALWGTIDGYLPDAITGESYGGRHREEARGQLLFEPGPDVSVRLIADYLHHGGTVNTPVYHVLGPTIPLVAKLAGVPVTAYGDAADVSQIDNKAPRFEFSDSAGASAQTDWLTGAGRFTAIASYRSSQTRRSYDVDGGPADIANDPRDGERYAMSTLEARLQGVAGRFDYLFGAFADRALIVSRDSYTAGSMFESYMNGMAGGSIPLFTGLPSGSNYPPGTGVFDVFRQRETRYALFTHQVVALSDTLSLSLGLRYTAESKSLAATLTSNNPGCANAVALHGRTLTGVPASMQGVICIPNLDPRYDGTYAADRAEGNWSGTAALNQKLTKSLDAYLQYSRGYKGGGFQLDRSGMDAVAPNASQLQFKQETADQVEAGMHLISADEVWRANAALFYETFDNYQFSYFTGLNRKTTDLPQLSTKGVEADAAWRPLPVLEISASAIYQEAVFGQSGFPSGLTQLEGTTAPLAPRVVFAAAASYRQPLPPLGVDGFANIDMRWQAKSNVGTSATPSPNVVQGAYATAGARLGVESRDGNWRLEVWARNLFQKRAWSLLYNTTLQPGSVSGFVIDPRTMGVTATVYF